MSQIITTQEATPPSSPPSSMWKIYAKADGLYIMTSDGVERGPLLTGTVGGAIGVVGTGSYLGTFSTLDFEGSNLFVSSSGTYARIFITGSSGGLSGVGVIGSGTYLGSFSTLDFEGPNVHVTSSGTYAQIIISGSYGNEIDLIPTDTSGTFSIINQGNNNQHHWYWKVTGDQILIMRDNSNMFTVDNVGDIYGGGNITTTATGTTVIIGATATGTTVNLEANGQVNMILSPDASINVNSHQIHNVMTGTSLNDAANVGQLSTVWNVVPGSPVRASNNQFYVADVGGANNYISLLSRETPLKWKQSGTVYQAVVATAVYGSNTGTITTMGDNMLYLDANSLKFSSKKATMVSLLIAGTLGVLNDASMRFYASMPYHLYGATPYVGASGTTNPTAFTITKVTTAGISSLILPTPLSVPSNAQSGADQTCNSSTTMLPGDYLTANVTGVSTTAPTDAYINILMYPDLNQYLT